MELMNLSRRGLAIPIYSTAESDGIEKFKE